MFSTSFVWLKAASRACFRGARAAAPAAAPAAARGFKSAKLLLLDQGCRMCCCTFFLSFVLCDSPAP
jgi:hypothetical protein